MPSGTITSSSPFSMAAQHRKNLKGSTGKAKFRVRYYLSLSERPPETIVFVCFFFPTRQKVLCWDPSTGEYSECGLNSLLGLVLGPSFTSTRNAGISGDIW